MSIDKPPVDLKRFYQTSVRKLCLKHLQLFVTIFNEQVQKIERSKESIIEVKCFNAAKSKTEERQKQMFMSTQIKSKLPARWRSG